MPHEFHERLARHNDLLARWRDLSAEELLADLNVLVQLVAFRYRQDMALLGARAAHAEGATHECREWLREGQCQVCGRID